MEVELDQFNLIENRLSMELRAIASSDVRGSLPHGASYRTRPQSYNAISIQSYLECRKSESRGLNFESTLVCY